MLIEGGNLAVLTLVVAFILSAALVPTEAAQCPQGAIALRAGKQLISAARAGSASRFAATLRNYADMRKIALSALGRHRKQLPASKIRDFTKAATILVSRTFNNYRRKFRAESISFVRCRGDRVYTNVYFPGRRGYQPVIWRFSGKRIVDINIQNIWLSQLLRSYLNEQMKKHAGNMNAVILEMKR